MFKNFREKCMAKNQGAVILLSNVSKIVEKILSGLKSSHSTADLLTVASGRIFRIFCSVWHVFFVLIRSSLKKFQVGYLVLFLYFSVKDRCRWF